jgi:hypothetical protein
MWNPFKRKFLVPIDQCYIQIIHVMLRDPSYSNCNLFEYLEEQHGVKRKWKNSTMSNYLVFDSEAEYNWFLLKL